MAQRDLSPKGIRDLVDAATTDVTALEAGASPYLSITAEDEEADAIGITIQVMDHTGAEKAGVYSILVEVLDDSFDAVQPAAFSVAAAGSGIAAAVGGTDTKTLFVTDATGELILAVTDAVGGADTSVYVKLTPFVRGMGPQVVSITFDNA